MSAIRKRTRKDEEDSMIVSHERRDGRRDDRRGDRDRGERDHDRDSRDRGRSQRTKYDAPPSPIEPPFDRARELFIGNLAGNNISESGLIRFLNDAMREGMLVGPNDLDPIINCRLSGKYGFLEFRDVDLCSKGLSLNGIPYQGHGIKVGRPSKFSGGIMTSMTWQELMVKIEEQKAISMASKQQNIHPVLGNIETKLYRELFIGNCTENMTEQGIQEFLGGMLYKLGLSNSGQENPILGAKSSGKFTFIVLRTPEECANMLNFNRIPYMNSHLKIERPAKYDGEVPGVSHFQWEEFISLYLNGELKVMTAGNPTKILRLMNQGNIPDVLNANTYVEMMDDTRTICAQYGTVKSVIIPRTGDPEIDVSKVFVEMGSVDEARAALIGIKGKLYNNRWVDVRFYPEDKFRSLNYSFESPPVVITSTYGPVFKEQVLNATALKKLWENEG